jgi:cytoplasmic tRNA 2-thiolation protein 2
MKDRTQEVYETVTLYSDIEFIPLRIQDAFDGKWWENITRTPYGLDPFVNIDLGTEGSCQQRP